MKSGAEIGTAKILGEGISWGHAPPRYKHHWLCTVQKSTCAENFQTNNATQTTKVAVYQCCSYEFINTVTVIPLGNTMP